jgi:peptidoglycan/LPS O-acetylase OafA/YrhL
MFDYETVRLHWIERLDASGELQRLSREHQCLLAGGSLGVLLKARMRVLERRRRLRRVLRRSTLAAATACALSLVVLLVPHVAPFSSGALAAPLSIVALLVALASHTAGNLLTKELARIEDLYQDLGRANHELERAFLR